MLNPSFNYVSYVDLLDAIRLGVARIPSDVELIVGIPRSGMIAAYAIGLYRNLPVVDLASFIENRWVGRGQTRSMGNQRELNSPQEARKILLVDDSLLSGGSLKLALSKIQAVFPGHTVTCAAIVPPHEGKAVDFFFKEVPLPRAFEWNIFHHPVTNKSCWDIDGVLCVDPSDEENDDGEKYRHFILNAPPLYLPTYEVGHIVSSRLEKYRPETEKWLERHGVKYKELHLIDLPSKEERLRLKAHHTHKISHYNRSGAELFIESELRQAVLISQGTGKPVVCTENMQIIAGSGAHIGNISAFALQKKKSVKRYVVSLLPSAVKYQLKALLKRQRV